jgi:enoyl-CoA hydratase/3-hydroxyacyl-CoA dehydrogenase
LRKPLFETANEIGIKNIVDELNKLAEVHGEFYKPDPLLESMI